MRIVIVPTPIMAHTTKIERPAGVVGEKSPRPRVVKVMKPTCNYMGSVTPAEELIVLTEI